MNTSNSVPANSEIASPPAFLWAWFVLFVLPLLRFFGGEWALGALHEFGVIRSDRCERHNAQIRTNSKRLWIRTVAAFRQSRFHRGITKLSHQDRARSSAGAMVATRAAGRQSGQRRAPRKGGQAKKAANDPGDGEPPRPPHRLPFSLDHTPPLRHILTLTRPLIFGSVR